MPLMITAVEVSSAPARGRVFNRMGNSRYRLRIDRGVPGVDVTRYEVGVRAVACLGSRPSERALSRSKSGFAWSAIRITPPLLAVPVHSAGAAGTLRKCPILGANRTFAK